MPKLRTNMKGISHPRVEASARLCDRSDWGDFTADEASTNELDAID